MTDTMGTMDIAFPNLGIYLENVPQYIYIGDFGIAIYGIMIAIGMILGIIMAAHIAKKTGQNPDTYWDISLWVIIFALIGARIYYVIFFWEAYRDDLSQIFNLRAGGLAIYGGVIAGVLTAYVYSVIKKLYLPEILDTLVYGLLVGQIIGRWGNFFNREVFGEYTDNILAMRLPIEMVRARDISDSLAATIADGTNYIQVHPTFLYESLWNLALLLLMLLYLKHRRFKGQMFLIYLAGYGIGRAWIESIRTDQLYIPGTEIPVNMVLAIVLAVVSIVAILYICNRKKDDPPVGLGLQAQESGSETQGSGETAQADTPVDAPADTETAPEDTYAQAQESGAVTRESEEAAQEDTSEETQESGEVAQEDASEEMQGSEGAAPGDPSAEVTAEEGVNAAAASEGADSGTPENGAHAAAAGETSPEDTPADAPTGTETAPEDADAGTPENGATEEQEVLIFDEYDASKDLP